MGKPGEQDHHYVPQFLLRPWCTRTDTGAAKLWACRRVAATGRLHHKQHVPRSTGFVRDLYRLQPTLVGYPDDSVPDAQAVEKEYSRLESEAAKIRDRFLGGEAPSSLTKDERKVWAGFMATLEHRTPREVQRAESAGLAMRERLRQEYREKFGATEYADKIFSQIDFDAMARNVARTAPLVHRDELSKPLDGWLWACVSCPTYDLITADYPIASLVQDGKCYATFLPLSPSRLFVAASSPFGRDFAEKAVLLSNVLIIQQKPNFIYSKEKLADGRITRLLAAAESLLEPPEHL